MKNTSIIKSVLMTSLIAAAIISTGCGGGGGGGGAASVSRGTMRLRLETPKEAYATATYTYTTSVAAAITVNSVAASGVSTAVASGTTAFTETCSSNSCSQSGGDFMITQIPPGTNYVVKAKLDLSTDSTVARQANTAYTYSYYYGALAKNIADGVTADVTVNGTSTVVALAAMRYAQTKSVALAAVSESAISAISSYIAASQTLLMYSFHCASQTSTTCADPFNVSNWTTTFTAQLDAILSNINVAASTAGCSAAAASYVSTAKSYILKSSVSSTDFASAKSAITSALTDSPNCPDANIVSALMDIGTEADRIGTQVDASGTTIFPYTLGYTSPASVGKLAGSVAGPVIDALPRFAGAGTLTSSSPPSDMQTAALASLTVLEGAVTKLTAAKSAIAAAGAGSWSFSYPKDPANLALGSVYIDANDLDLIIGAIQFVTGYGYFALSYNLDIPSSYSTSDPCPEYKYTWNGTSWTQSVDTTWDALSKLNLCAAADTNNDKTITPAEYVPGPSTFGTRTANAATYLAKSQTDISTGLLNMYTAVTNTLAEVSGTLGGVSITSQAISDATYYKHYLSDLAASFGGTTTNIAIPAEVDCWRSYTSFSGGTYYRADSVMDPTQNTTQLAGCLLQVQTLDPFTAPLNLGAQNVTDIRSVLSNYTIDAGGNIDAAPGSSAFGGMIPGGVQSSWDSGKTYDYNFYFQNMTNSTTGAVITNLPSTGVTLVIGGKTLTPDISGGNALIFNRTSSPSTLPAATDYFTVNGLTGVTATLTVPGYQAKQFTVIGNYASPILSLTP